MSGKALAHNVYFQLNESTSANRQALIAAARKYLTVQPGILFFAVGELAEELARPVNDREWDVGLHIVFTDQAAHDAYQVDASHEQFVAEQKSNWKRVRVFDSLVEVVRV
jgi:hypothetical protein